MRRKDREVTEVRDILNIVGRAKILHLGLFDQEYPYIVPLHYGYELVDGTLVFFMHSAESGQKLALIRNNANVCIELDCDIELISGGDNPCEYGSAFASVIGWGRAEIVSDEEEKIKGLRLLMENQTGRDFEIDSSMASSVAVIKVVVSEFMAKSRPMPHLD
ncbi:MAG: pyridoxamine 5'-phosphate oxidase family protein [Saccharofermentanales bacterium]|jgi:nitroimidazol reductase NimA-like FMN-containing flavoprotein (pyridoxamine 5'-phosphate oxidase superfamily)|nr:pyridoxamine 5'-phosphate oxidase family protein [Bacillota bacterium]NLB08107.1 pyridoxamine 5'-phosphate oxidase family protein [Clostridiales bacterium]